MQGDETSQHKLQKKVGLFVYIVIVLYKIVKTKGTKKLVTEGLLLITSKHY